MRVVNLSRRPFLNRRPVARIAVLLWVIGGLLLATNAWLYAGYLSGTTKNRERLAELNAEIDSAENDFDEVGRRLGQVSLGERNQRAAYLNDLIDERTFPWSRLFDDLEDALLDDVYLTLVAPSVEEESQEARPRAASRTITPREARRRAQERRSGGSSGSRAEAGSSMPTPESANVAEEADFDVVELSLQGIARTDEAMLDFVDALYRNGGFVDPNLQTEQRDEKTGDIQFGIIVYYLLPRTVSPLDDAATGDGRMADGTTEGIAEGTAEGTTEGTAESTVDGEDEMAGKEPANTAGVPVKKFGDGETASAAAPKADSPTGRPPADRKADPATGSTASDKESASSGRSSDRAEIERKLRERRQLAEDAADERDVGRGRDRTTRTPGEPTDRRRPSLSEERSSDDLSDGRDERDAEPPDLTEPAASASPVLKRLGSEGGPT